MTEHEKISKILEKVQKQEIRVSYQENVDETLPVMTSKIGGCPSLPEDFVWPRYKGEAFDGVDKERPLSFMAQINLSDVAIYDEEGLLPHTGMLSFFYELMTMRWGFDPEDTGCAKVYYFSEGTALSRTAAPKDLEEDAVMPECSISFDKHISLPEYQDYKKLDSEAQGNVRLWEVYDEVCCELGYMRDNWGNRTKLLGYPDVIQNSMEEECESLLRGYRRGCPEDFAKIPENVKLEIKEKSTDWMLLFQMGTIETGDSEIMFGDCGHIYFWIRKQDLQALDFENVWLILQCS